MPELWHSNEGSESVFHACNSLDLAQVRLFEKSLTHTLSTYSADLQCQQL